MRVITDEDWRLVRQHVIQVQMEVIVIDSDGTETILTGITNGGNLNLDSGSAIRRTASFSLTPSKETQNINEQSLIWLNKRVEVSLSIVDQRDRSNNVWYKLGTFIYNNASVSFSVSENILNIELSDMTMQLDGTTNGQVGGALTTVYRAYEEDEEGKPIPGTYSTISGAICKTLHSAGYEPYWEAFNCSRVMSATRWSLTYTIRYQPHSSSAILDEFEMEIDAGTLDFEKTYYVATLKKVGNDISLVANELCYFEETIYEPGDVIDFCHLGETESRWFSYGHEAHSPYKTFIVEEIGEYYGVEEYNPDGYEAYRKQYPLWNIIPYDLEFSVGATLWEIISELVQLYPNYDAAHDEDGRFRVQMIPSEYSKENDFYFEDYEDMVISEQTSTDMTGVKNICEVWGEALDADGYAEDVAKGAMMRYYITSHLVDNIYKVTGYVDFIGTYGGTFREDIDITIYQSGTVDQSIHTIRIWYQDNTLSVIALNNIHYNAHDYHSNETIMSCAYGEEIGNVGVGNIMEGYIASTLEPPHSSQGRFVMLVKDYKEYRDGDRFGVKFSANNPYEYEDFMQINDLSPIGIVKEDGSDYMPSDSLDSTHIHVFQLVKIKTGVDPQTQEDTYGYQFYYIGVSQPHAIDVLTDGTVGEMIEWEDPITHEITRFHKYSEDYYKTVYNCDTVNMTVCEQSPFVVQKIGEIIDVKADGEFGNIRSNQLAVERATYENWKNSRLTDSISITTKLMPFVEPYMKIDYKRHDSGIRNDYIVQSVSHDLENGTTTIQMYTFYPLYHKEQPGELYAMTYKYMGGYLNKDLYGNQDE